MLTMLTPTMVRCSGETQQSTECLVATDVLPSGLVSHCKGRTEMMATGKYMIWNALPFAFMMAVRVTRLPESRMHKNASKMTTLKTGKTSTDPK